MGHPKDNGVRKKQNQFEVLNTNSSVRDYPVAAEQARQTPPPQLPDQYLAD